MLKLGTFYDNETTAEYDLYQVSAKVVRSWLDKSFPVTQLKLNLFNSSTRTKYAIDYEIQNGLEFDYREGKILNMDAYSEIERSNSCKNQILDAKESIGLSEGDNKRHLLGYELLPLAISVKDKNLVNFDKVYLLDGFRRMYYMADVPDIPVFVKVYDLLEPKQWNNAMLLYNSWKLVQSENFELFVDRGFKFGLYTYFGIDVTIYSERALELFQSYIDKNFYTKMKDSRVLSEDIKISLELYDKYVSKGQIGYMSPSQMKAAYVLKELFLSLGKIRSAEYRNGTQANAKVLTIEMVDELFSRPAIAKHLKKVESMQVGGFIENYVEKHFRLPICNMLRKLYDTEELSEKYISFFGKFSRYDVLTPKSFYDAKLAEDAQRTADRKAAHFELYGK